MWGSNSVLSPTLPSVSGGITMAFLLHLEKDIDRALTIRAAELGTSKHALVEEFCSSALLSSPGIDVRRETDDSNAEAGKAGS
jgi:hypothetical protein